MTTVGGAQEELKNWAVDLGLVAKPRGEFENLVANGRRFVVEDLTAVEEIRKQRQYAAEDAALGEEAFLRKAMKAQQAREDDDAVAAGLQRKDSTASSVSMSLLATHNVLTQNTLAGTSIMGGGVLDPAASAITFLDKGSVVHFADGGAAATLGRSVSATGLLGSLRPPARDNSMPQYPIVRSLSSHVAPLCWDWVLAKCSAGAGSGNHCPRHCRHYFVSHVERANALRARMIEDAVLERTVVAAITERECLVDLLAELVDDKRREFEEQMITRRPTQADLAELLSTMNECTCRGTCLRLCVVVVPTMALSRLRVVVGLMRRGPGGAGWMDELVTVWLLPPPANPALLHRALLVAVRVATVRVVEAVEQWRRAEEARAKAKARSVTFSSSGALTQRTYTVRMLVTGNKLYEASKAFSSITGQLKRMQRSEQEAFRPKEVRLIGVYDSELEACTAYDEAINAEAIRMGVNPASLPARRVVIKACGKHLGVESIGIRSSGCEVSVWQCPSFVQPVLLSVCFRTPRTSLCLLCGDVC